MSSSFAHTFGRRLPHFLGDPVDDFVAASESRLTEFVNDKIQAAADSAFDHVYARFEERLPAITDEIIASAQPKLEQAAQDSLTKLAPVAQQQLYAIFDDAQTQARLGATADQIEARFTNSIILAVGVGAVATTLMTWALLRYAGR